jgi:hypothetical protein
MTSIKKLAGAAFAAALLAVPAVAADTVTFAQFTQQSANKAAQYRNTGAGNTLDIIQGSPANFVVFDFGAPGVYGSTMSLAASSTQSVMMSGSVFQQNGWDGSINFGNGSNYLTVNFTGATLNVDSNGGSASLINTDPTSTISYSSNFLTLPDFDTKSFSLAFTGLLPFFQIADNGFGSNFDANIAGSFSGTPGGEGPGGVIPEPATWAMLVIGFGLTGATMRRRSGRRVVAS